MFTAVISPLEASWNFIIPLYSFEPRSTFVSALCPAKYASVFVIRNMGSPLTERISTSEGATAEPPNEAAAVCASLID